jgi:hypothetical protein
VQVVPDQWYKAVVLGELEEELPVERPRGLLADEVAGG